MFDFVVECDVLLFDCYMLVTLSCRRAGLKACIGNRSLSGALQGAKLSVFAHCPAQSWEVSVEFMHVFCGFMRSLFVMCVLFYADFPSPG